jgi:hypothetical protein
MSSVMTHQQRDQEVLPPSLQGAHPTPPKNAGLEIARKGWPLIGVCGAMASTAWLPSEYPTLGVVVLIAEVALGVYGIVRLISPNNH